MKLALYRARAGNWLDGAINAASGFGGYSHVELVFGDGQSFSSTSRGDDGSCRYADGRPKRDGTRYKEIFYATHPDRWALHDLVVPAAAERAMREFADGELDARYDFAGCARFVVPFWRQHRSKWFCSEVVVATLQSTGYLRGHAPHRVSPNDLAKLFEVS